VQPRGSHWTSRRWTFRDWFLNHTTHLREPWLRTSVLRHWDVLFGRQVALLLQSGVPASVRLAVWRELEEGHGLELLPPLHVCMGGAGLYLLSPLHGGAAEEPAWLNALVGSAVSGSLGRCKQRNAMTYPVALTFSCILPLRGHCVGPRLDQSHAYCPFCFPRASH